MDITVFTKNNCMQCRMTKKLLDKLNIDYKTINTDENPEHLDGLRARGVGSLPVTVVGDEMILGFSPEKLRKLAN